MIWTSRAIAFLVPLALIALTVITGIPLFGLLTSLLIGAIVALVMVLLTVVMFYKEFGSVEDFKSRELRVKEFFHGFPAYTDVPVIENQPNEWVAYGHVDPQEFITAIQTVLEHVTEDEAQVEAYDGLQESVGHLYAHFVNPKEGHWSEGIELCKPSAEGCFPITRLIKT